MRAGGLAVLPIVVFVLAGMAAAQDRDGQWQRCTLYDEHGKVRAGANLELVIDACTAIIQAGQETPKQLAFALANRGYAYRNKYDYDRAIQDLDQAIKLDPDNALALSTAVTPTATSASTTTPSGTTIRRSSSTRITPSP